MIPDRHQNFSQKATSVAFCVCTLLYLLLAASACAEEWHVRVRHVIDGDTVVLENGDHLRLAGIDAPELPHKDRPGQYFGRESRDMLRDLVAGQTLVLERDSLERDRYKRLVGDAHLEDGRSICQLMVEQGGAFVYPHLSYRVASQDELLLAAQRSAMTRQVGFWPVILRLPPADYTGSRRSMRFHSSSCPNGRRIGASNRIRFSTPGEAFAQGYAPARECTPWPGD